MNLEENHSFPQSASILENQICELWHIPGVAACYRSCSVTRNSKPKLSKNQILEQPVTINITRIKFLICPSTFNSTVYETLHCNGTYRYKYTDDNKKKALLMHLHTHMHTRTHACTHTHMHKHTHTSAVLSLFLPLYEKISAQKILHLTLAHCTFWSIVKWHAYHHTHFLKNTFTFSQFFLSSLASECATSQSNCISRVSNSGRFKVIVCGQTSLEPPSCSNVKESEKSMLKTKTNTV